MSSQLVWLITGTSSGIGRDLTLAALARGDRVVATARARSIRQLEPLREKGADVLELDVTASLADLHAIAKKAVELHGKVDVVVNNAGYIAVGAIEENTPEETFAQFNTNVFGALNVARAFLPYMRARKSGTILWLGSLGGWRFGPNAGLYAGTKHALRGLSGSLDVEISPLGLRSIIVELGYFRTNFLTDGNRAPHISRIDDYAPITGPANDNLIAYNGKQPGDPKKAAELMVDLVHGEGAVKGRTIPPVVDLGSDCHQVVKEAAESTLQRLEEWKDIAHSTDLPK
ncbi:hypothetical protein OF83DRAFT_1059594 [Amylostereum chailletii]|nr:hypothetical protein OF83DRAFT_1059594 [Amylostereum chailletii]